MKAPRARRKAYLAQGNATSWIVFGAAVAAVGTVIEGTALWTTSTISIAGLVLIVVGTALAPFGVFVRQQLAAPRIVAHVHGAITRGCLDEADTMLDEVKASSRAMRRMVGLQRAIVAMRRGDVTRARCSPRRRWPYRRASASGSSAKEVSRASVRGSPRCSMRMRETSTGHGQRPRLCSAQRRTQPVRRRSRTPLSPRLWSASVRGIEIRFGARWTGTVISSSRGRGLASDRLFGPTYGSPTQRPRARTARFRRRRQQNQRAGNPRSPTGWPRSLPVRPPS